MLCSAMTMMLTAWLWLEPCDCRNQSRGSFFSTPCLSEHQRSSAFICSLATIYLLLVVARVAHRAALIVHSFFSSLGHPPKNRFGSTAQ